MEPNGINGNGNVFFQGALKNDGDSNKCGFYILLDLALRDVLLL